jgi:hypothetical protein
MIPVQYRRTRDLAGKDLRLLIGVVKGFERRVDGHETLQETAHPSTDPALAGRRVIEGPSIDEQTADRRWRR